MHLVVAAHLEHERHSDFSMELDVAVEEPIARIIGYKSDNCVATIGHGDGVLLWRPKQSPFQLALLVQQLNLLQVHARVEPFHADDSESVSV